MVGAIFQNHDGVGAAHIGVVFRLNLHIMSQRRQSVDGFLRETAFQIRLARVVRIEARRINRIRQIHVVVNDVGNHVHHRRNDLRAAGEPDTIIAVPSGLRRMVGVMLDRESLPGAMEFGLPFAVSKLIKPLERTKPPTVMPRQSES